MIRRNVLIFQAGGLGDFILTWPFALAMARVYPQSRVFYITHSQKGQLAQRLLKLECRDLETGWHLLHTPGAAGLTEAHLKLIESAHAIYSFLPAEPVWDQNVAAINPAAKRLTIDPRPTRDFAEHHSQWLLDQLKEHKVEQSAMEGILRWVAERGIGVPPTPRQGILLHPGAGGREKCWPIARWVELAMKLNRSGQPVRFVIGEVERERFSEADQKALAAAASVVPCDTYLQLLDQMATAVAFIGNDSGPAHLAGIIGLKTVALFGPTNSKVWHPLGPQVMTIAKPAMDDIATDEVLTALGRQAG